jgi:hypothetical protein
MTVAMITASGMAAIAAAPTIAVERSSPDRAMRLVASAAMTVAAPATAAPSTMSAAKPGGRAGSGSATSMRCRTMIAPKTHSPASR